MRRGLYDGRVRWWWVLSWRWNGMLMDDQRLGIRKRVTAEDSACETSSG